MEIILSNASPKPIYEQITSQIKAMIMNGELKAGDPMPSMRKLAKELHVSVITTQRAYDDLQKDGFIVTVPAKGTFVSAQNQDFIREENRRRVELLLTDAVELAKENGIELRVVDRWYPSSKTCHYCGAIRKDLKLSDRIFQCDCGYIEDRDFNAALNLRDAMTYEVA